MRREEPSHERCALCGREVPAHLITQHHLRPKEKGGKAEDRAAMCRPCHKQLHAMFSNNDLAKLYDSVEALRGAPVLQPFLRWIRRQKPDRTFKTRTSNGHPDARRRGKRRWS